LLSGSKVLGAEQIGACATMADLIQLGASDFAAATISAGLVAPFVAACDKAIAESAAGQGDVWTSVFKSIREIRSAPITFLKGPAFRCLWVMYGGTYAIANLFRTYDEYTRTSQPLIKTGTIFGVNTSLSLWKDSTFAKLFSGGKPAAAIPKPALASWYLRDFAGMAVIFTGPPIAAKYAHESLGVSLTTAEVVAQTTLPLMVQPIQAPLHLYGYVLYNDPKASFSTQVAAMRSGIWGAVQMRMTRCVAPYCVGTNLNTTIRQALRSKGA